MKNTAAQLACTTQDLRCRPVPYQHPASLSFVGLRRTLMALWLLLASAVPVAAEGPRYNEVQQKSSHNAYAQRIGLLDQLVYHRVRSLELDLHKGRWWGETENDFSVYHVNLPFFNGTSCDTLSDCLHALATFHMARPRHEVVTIWLDVKDTLSDRHSAAVLDRILARSIDPEWTFSPRKLRERCEGAASLRQAVGRCGWPSLETLKGMFLFVVTGETPAYARPERGDPVAFVAPEISRVGEIETHGDTVFFNMPSRFASLARYVVRAGYDARVFGIDDAQAWERTHIAGAQHIATDHIEGDL